MTLLSPMRLEGPVRTPRVALVLVVMLTLVVAMLVGFGGSAVAAKKKDNRVGPIKWPIGVGACAYADGRVTAVLGQAPKVKMSRYWSQPHGGGLAVDQYVVLTNTLLGLRGSTWVPLASQKLSTKVTRARNIRHWKPMNHVKPFTSLPAGYSSFRILQRVVWLKPANAKPDGSLSHTFVLYVGGPVKDGCAEVPHVVTGAAAVNGATKARISGTVSGMGAPATYRVYYGTSTAYGAETPPIGGLPADFSDHAVSVAMDGLSGATTYHYRLVAQTGDVTSYGADQTFTTKPGATSVSVGSNNACALLQGGSVTCWGYNGDGELGNGTRQDSAVPVAVSDLAGATAVSTGGGFSCAVVAGGAVRCWGSNGSGQLGNSGGNSAAPVSVPGISGATAIAAGSSHACAIVAGGAVKCWGNGASGQLGNGSTGSSASPVTVTGLSGATAISAGADHTCVQMSDGSARCWGGDGSGQLGNNSTTNVSTPVVVQGLTGVASLSAGNGDSCAVTSAGVRCWGQNASGQLGNGSTSSSSVPVAVVPTLLGANTQISAGTSDSCLVVGGGNVRCWGLNQLGQLGNGSTVNSSSPVEVGGITGVAQVAVGTYSACALFATGGIDCWGNGANGRLGTGTTAGSSVPVPVVGY